MADYTSVSKLQKYAQDLTFTTTSQPTDTQVERFISDVSSEMELRMQAHGVDVPVTKEAALDYLDRICAAGVLARVYQSNGMDPEEVERRQTEFNTELERIEENPDIVRAESSQSVSPGYNRNADAARELSIERNTTQW